MPTSTLAAPAAKPPELIILVRNRVVQDAAGCEHRVESITLEPESFCCDVAVNAPSASYELCQDEVFLAAVMALLRETGYVGPGFGRAEMGLQDQGRIVLEAGDDFQDFAITRGWRYAEGNDTLYANRLLRTIPWSAAACFTASNGAVYGVRAQFLVERYAREHVAEHGSLRASVQHALNLVEADESVLVQWLWAMGWARAHEYVSIIKNPPEIDLEAEFAAAVRPCVRGLGAKR